MESAVVPNYVPSEAKKTADLMQIILRKANLEARRMVAESNKRVTQARRKEVAASEAAAEAAELAEREAAKLKPASEDPVIAPEAGSTKK